jgi:TfoX/Sxy family transcriptional regulator of competence genes
MAFDEDVAERIRTLLAGRADVHEQKLFGGLCFMVRGHMCCAVSGRGGLLVRVGPDAPPSLFREPHASAMEMRGRIMAGYVRVASDGYRNAASLKKWVTRAVDFVATLPMRAKKTATKKASATKKTKVTKRKK